MKLFHGKEAGRQVKAFGLYSVCDVTQLKQKAAMMGPAFRN